MPCRATPPSAEPRTWNCPACGRGRSRPPRLLEPLLSWAEPQTVYVTYGKLWLFVFGAMTACAFLVRRGRVDAGLVRGVEKVGWWLALPAYALLTVGLAGVYWTPFLEETFNAVAVPAMLLSIVGSLVLGIGLLRRRVRPLAAGVLLVAYGPLFFVISDLVALGAAMLPVVWAWGLAGRDLDRTAAAAPKREPVNV